MGAENIEILNRAVSFLGDKEMLYRTNYELRTALKILSSISSFKANNSAQLYEGIFKIPWDEYFDVDKTFAVNSVIFTNNFQHSGFVTLKVKDAIVDKFRQIYDKRPSIDTRTPDIRINILIQNNIVKVSIDSSGEPLFKRGYRTKHGKASLSEVLAAGMILLSKWDIGTDFVDFMCGSGTLPIEAALIAYNIPPQIKREEFAFQNWKNFDEKLWESVKEKANNKRKNKDEVKSKIFASDKSFKSISFARENIENIQLDEIIILEKIALSKLDFKESKKHIVINPPYGERLEIKDIDGLYKEIGDELKNKYSGSDAWILSGNFQALKNIGLRTSKKITLYNGALECKFQKYEMYKGSKKNRN